MPQKDIDLYIPCAPNNFDQYLPGLISLIGCPRKRRRSFIEWHFIENGCSVELLLVDPSSHMFYMPIKTFETLRKNKDLIEEYKKIKATSHGLSIREYQKKRVIFFNRVFGL